jgi:c-di-GMP phosphodiesterase
MKKIPLMRRLATRLAGWVVLIALSLGIIFGVLQVYLDYFNVHSEFDKGIWDTLSSLKKPATQAAYHLDPVLADEVVQGLFNYPAIHKISLFDEQGNILASDQRPLEKSRWRWISEISFRGREHFSLPLRSDEGEQKLYGLLEVFIDPHVLAKGFLERAYVVLLSGLLRNLLLAMIIFFLFQYLVNKPLAKMAKTLTQVDPQNPEGTRLLCPKGHEQDELGQLACSTNELITHICERVNERQQMLEKLANAAEENARLLRLATTDGLTGLYIRRYFEVRYEEEYRRAQRYRDPLSLLMLDIDHFKGINDNYGHQFGDKVIQKVAQIIIEQVRAEIDFPARYGGEEFIVLLPHTKREGACSLAERIRRACADYVFILGEQSLHVTLSLGVATLHHNNAPGCNPEVLIERADKALYRAKENGRNRVECFSA